MKNVLFYKQLLQTIIVIILISGSAIGQISEVNDLKNSKVLTQIKHIRFGSTADPLSGLTITWSAKGNNDSIQWGYSSSYEKGKFSAKKRDGYENYFYDYAFPVLDANSMIYYKIYDSYSAEWTGENTFVTANEATGTKFSFLAMGDSRTYVEDWRDVSNAANQNQTDFTLFTGDIVSNGGDFTDWNEWFEYGEKFLANNLVYHTIGNHECRNGGDSIYSNNFCLPENNTNTKFYYSFIYGNSIFICLDTEEDDTPTDASVQYNWLKETLQANKDKTWKFVWFHRPFYTTGGHAGEMDYKMDTWFDAFDTYGVDMIFTGHDHMYERTKPVQKDGKIVDEYGSTSNQGRCQIVCGGAGAPLYTPGTADWLETAAAKYHYCKVDIDGYTLKLEVYDKDNNLFDELTIEKSLTAVSQNISEQLINLYPNPSNNQIVIKGEDLNIAEIKFYNSQGKDYSHLVQFSAANKNVVTADLSNLPQGIYFVNINTKIYKFFKN